MLNNYFQVLREGTHTTFQDKGFVNKQNLGISSGGVIDYELFVLANKLVSNTLEAPVIEFSIQGPSLKFIGNSCRFVITGNVLFKIIKKKETINGKPNQSYLIKKGEIIDVLLTLKSNYGYLSVEGGFQIKKEFNSFSTLTIAKIGANNGEKIHNKQKIFINHEGSNKRNSIEIEKKENTKNFIRVIAGPQMNYFFPKTIQKFFKRSFRVSNSSNRMGVRLYNNICKAVISHNIPSEGIIKGSVQVPGDGNPIVLLNDHPTIGGYPKIATVILTDIHKLAQLPMGSNFFFELISLDEAEYLYIDSMLEMERKFISISSN